jgi:hypothetical protein
MINSLRALALTALLVLAAPAAASASADQESMFQDDPLLVFGSAERVESTINRLQSMGVDRLRISVFWNLVAPAPTATQRPAFDATNPAAYPAQSWERYDRIVRLAAARGIGVNFNPTSPVPRWAAQGSPRTDLQKNYGPDPIQFGQFVQALGTRYSGTYQGLPRVSYWSIWNEPNQAGWLTPQWARDPGNPKRQVEAAPHLYRQLVQTGYAGLTNSGHAQDTILIGETAPKGQQRRRGASQSIDALRFLRQMYCLDDNLQILRGSAAEVRGCPPVVNGPAFVAANPALFKATGYAHHPYELLTAPTRKPGWDDWATIANLGDLEGELRRIYARYGQPTQEPRGVPLYLTEYGYQTPPDPFGVSFTKQAAYQNQSEFIAYKNPLVKTLSQFLLVDDAPAPGVDPKRNPQAAYITFQSGLRSLSGKDKPSLKAYITPIFVDGRRFAKGGSTRVFALLRPSPGGAPKPAQIQFRRKGSRRWRTIATRNATGTRAYLDTRVKPPGTGVLRVLWSDGGRPTASRAVSVTAR